MTDPSKKSPAPPRDAFSERYARNRSQLSPAFRKVADFINSHRVDALASSAAEIGRIIGTSDATVVRAVQALGFEGLQDLRAALTASLGQRHAPAENLTRTLADVGHSAEAAMDEVLDAMVEGLATLREPQIREALQAALRELHVARRIVIFGIGPTAHIAAYFAFRLRRKGRRQWVLDRTGAGLADQLLELSVDDAILMMAYGEPYREAEAVLAEAERLRIPIVLVTDTPESEMASAASVVLTVPRGRIGRVALHGATVTCLEMLLLGLATADKDQSVATLGELDRLRKLSQSKFRASRPSPARDGK